MGFLITLIPEIQPVAQQDTGLGLIEHLGCDVVLQRIEFGYAL